jgi:hypothetical protein
VRLGAETGRRLLCSGSNDEQTQEVTHDRLQGL